MTVWQPLQSYGKLDCLKYLVEEAKVPLDNWQLAIHRLGSTECLNYLLENGRPGPTDEEYAAFAVRQATRMRE
ncbi:unnamed protein product [Bathycoccus prasinos]